MSRIKRDRSIFIFLKRLSDAFLPLVLLYVIAHFYGVLWDDSYNLLGLIGGVLFVITGQMFGAYDNWRTRSLSETFQMVIKSWGTTVALLIILIFLQKRSQDYSRVAITLWAIILPLVLLLIRAISTQVMRYSFARGFYTKTVAVVGAGNVGQYLAELLLQHPYLGYSIYGYYDRNPELAGKIINGISVLGNHLRAYEDAKAGLIDELYLCLPLGEEKDIIELMNQLAQTTVVVKYVPDLFAFDLLHAKWIDLKGLPVVSVYDTPMSSSSARFMKRIEDLVLTSIILFLLWPVMLVVALAVKFTSPGPVFYRQTRIGWNGKPFTIFKFRSMIVHSETGMLTQAVPDDKRVTPVGRFIRRTSLDELPQLFNVFFGQMSLVGPRPHALSHHEYYNKHVDRYMQRHLIKPGLTGYAQISGNRGETQTVEKMKMRIELDRYYISNWSLWLDLKIIILSAVKGWTDKNAY